MGGLSTRTVLFTDVVASTEQRVAMGDDAADVLVHRHDELVRTAVEAAGGSVVKGLGDGAMAAFSSAVDAVAAAVELQRALARDGRRRPAQQQLSVRIGISTGDVHEDGGDLFGTPVVEASRLCAAAGGGEILVAELVRLLARGRGGATFEPVGDLSLRGLPDPVPACRVLWVPVQEHASAAVPLPPLLATTPASSYVGRSDVLAELEQAWKTVVTGGRRTVLLVGEPGIGKTRTAAELARQVHSTGGLVLFGRCDEGLAVPYQPFVEALELYARSLSDAAELGRLPGELRRLVPELAELSPGIGAPVDTDVRSEEYRLFEAVTSWLAAASRTDGLLLVLDDLHWAALPTLQLLLHVLRRLADEQDARVLVVGTYRDTDVDRAHPLTDALADLRRRPEVSRLPLVGLDADDVLRVLEEAAGHDLDDDAKALAGVLRAETEGNPFFVGEVLRHLVESGAVRRVEGRWLVPAAVDLDIPEGVRDVVSRRVSRLSDDADRVLTVAAVVGREASLDVLAAVSGLDEDIVCDALDEGVRARLLNETGADRYRFSHALVRTTLYEQLSATRRRRLHRRVADVLEQLHGDDVISLAHHLLEAGPDNGSSERAVQYVLAAGQRALDGRAPADAETWFRHALELLEDDGDEVSALRAACGLGQAQRDQADPQYRQTLLDVARAACDAGHTDVLVQAVLINQRGYASLMGRVDGERVELVEQALSAVGPDPTPVRIRLLALLACEVLFGDRSRGRALAAEAVALARDLGDGPTLTAVLVQTCGPAYDPADMAGWARLLDEAVTRADALGDPAMRALARLFGCAADLARGDFPTARRRTDELVAAAAAGSPGLVWAARAHALRFVIAEQPPAISSVENDACLQTGEAAGEADRLAWWAGSGTAIAVVEHYRIGALSDLAADFADQNPGSRIWWCTAAWALADAGELDRARAVVREHRLDPQDVLDEPWPYVGPWILARVAYRCGDRDLAIATSRALAPFRGGWAHYYIGISGPVTGPLGLCASVLGKHDDAVALAEEAVQAVRRAGLVSLLPPHELDLVAVLRARDAEGDRARVLDLCRDVARRATATGCSGVVAEAESVLAELDAGPTG